MNELEISIDVPMNIKVKFSVQKAEKMTRHYPGCPAHVDDISFIVLAERLVYPLSFDIEKNRHKTEEVEIAVCDHLHEMILDAQGWDEWQEQCMESVREDETERQISRYEERRCA